MPDEPVDVQAIIDKADDSFAKFTKGRADLGNQVESLEDAIDAIKNGMKGRRASHV